MTEPYLAPELIQAIAEQCGDADARSLRLTCKCVEEIVAAVVLKRIVIRVASVEDVEGLKVVESLAASDGDSIRRFTRDLVIREVSSRLRSEADESGEATGAGETTPPIGYASEDQFKEQWRQAMSQFTRLTSLHWNTGIHEPPWVKEVTTDALRPVLPRLERIELIRHSGDLAPMLENVSGLKHLKVFFMELLPTPRPPTSDPNDAMHAIAGVVQRSSHSLQHLAIDTTWWPITTAVQFLFVDPLDTSSPSTTGDFRTLTSLKLGIPSTALQSSYSSLPQLSALQTFDLNLRGEQNDRNAKQCPLDSGTCIWTALKNTGVRLKSIKCDMVCKGFIDYTASYQGVLEELTVYPHRLRQEAQISELQADRFFDLALPPHHSSIRVLEIMGSYHSRWCFRECTTRRNWLHGPWDRLQMLKISIYLQDPALLDEDPLKSLLLGSTSLPALTEIYAELIVDLHGQGFVGFMDRWNQGESIAVSRMRNYRFRDDELCSGVRVGMDPPTVFIAHYAFRPQRDGGGWIYVD